jgi:hypothetical protein
VSDNTAVLNGDALGDNTGDSLTTPLANRSAVLLVTVWGKHLVKGEITWENTDDGDSDLSRRSKRGLGGG